MEVKGKLEIKKDTIKERIKDLIKKIFSLKCIFGLITPTVLLVLKLLPAEYYVGIILAVLIGREAAKKFQNKIGN